MSPALRGGLLVVAAGAVGLQAVHVRRDRGATGEEAAATLPGDELVPEPAEDTTLAVTVHAPAGEVWAWLVQVGQDRGGMYSYDRLENLIGLRIHSTDEIREEWQHLAVGDRVVVVPEGYGPMPGGYAFTVARVEPPRTLVLPRAPPEHRWNGVWSFPRRPHRGRPLPAAGPLPHRGRTTGRPATGDPGGGAGDAGDGPAGAARDRTEGRTPAGAGPVVNGGSIDIVGLVEAAVLAPSSHNTQPWWFRVGEHTVELHADRTRALPVNDPFDRELTISCGAALMTLLVAARTRGLEPDVAVLPDPDDPDLLARIIVVPGAQPADEELAPAIPARHTHRERSRGAAHPRPAAGRAPPRPAHAPPRPAPPVRWPTS
ncbi:hypothetical protein [Geodermatophilus sp. SYSU D01176]